MEDIKKGTLYLCATPIGNLEDITYRALRLLKECDLIAAEDTRHTRKLLANYDIHTPLTSYHAHNEKKKGEKLIEKLMLGLDIVVVSDAGMPGISDPGAEIVQLALAQDILVVPIPGASAGISALVVSGLPTARFCFEGFLPANKKGRRRQLEKLVNENRTIIFYEGPHRVIETLKDLLRIFGDRKLAVARELTKKHEQIFRGKISDAVNYFELSPPRGEFCLVVAGAEETDIKTSGWDDLPLLEHVEQMVAGGMDKKEAIKEVAKLRGLPKREVYAAVNTEN